MTTTYSLTTETVTVALARAYYDAVSGANYDASGRNDRAEGVIDAACAVLNNDDRDDVETILDDYRYDFEDDG